MQRISEMFVLLLLVFSESLVVATSVDEIDLESFFRALRNVDSSFLVKEIIEETRKYPGEPGEPLNTLPPEGFAKLLEWLSIGRNDTPKEPLEIPKRLLAHAEGMKQIPEILSLVTDRRDFLLTILENLTLNNETANAVVEFCKVNNSTGLEKFHSTIHSLMVSGLLNYSNFRHEFGNNRTQGNYSTDACEEWVVELRQFIKLVFELRKGELKITHLGAGCEWLTGTVNTHCYNNKLKLAAERSLNRTKYHESLIEPLTTELVQDIKDCEPTPKLSDGLAKIKELLDSAETIGARRVNRDRRSIILARLKALD